MTANWFEAKVKYMKVSEDGKEKKVNAWEITMELALVIFAL